MAMSENTKRVLEYLKEVHGENVTAADVAEALDLPKKTVDGCFTSGICRKDLGERVVATVKNEDGTTKQVKFFVLNENGLNFDPDAVPEK